MSWEERARKLESRRRRMRVQGRGLITIEPLAINKRLKKLQNQPGRKAARKGG